MPNSLYLQQRTVYLYKIQSTQTEEECMVYLLDFRGFQDRTMFVEYMSSQPVRTEQLFLFIG